MAVYHEHEIQSHLQCPLLDSPREAGGALGSCLDVLRWALRESFAGRRVQVETLRRRLVVLLDKTDPPKDMAYYAAVRLGNTAAKRIYLFLEAYRVLRPMTRYDMALGGDRVTGEYAVVHKRSGALTETLPLILVAHASRPNQYKAVSSLEILRHLDLMLDSTYTDIGIYHLPLWRGKPWKQEYFDLPLVRLAAGGILGSMRQSGFPVPGAHCVDCRTRACERLASA